VLASGDKAISGKKWFSFVAWRFVYSDEMRELIHHFKFNGFSRLRYPLGSEMSETVLGHQELNTADMITAVPLHRARLRERGYNQSLLLARAVSELTHIPVVEVLERIKNTLPQATLKTADDKIWNVNGIFTVKNRKDVQGKRIILVDDIFTTGATANECSKMLAGAGARKIMVVTAAYAG
jgi:ComF family protein